MPLSPLELIAVGIDILAPDPIPGLPGPLTTAVIARHGMSLFEKLPDGVSVEERDRVFNELAQYQRGAPEAAMERLQYAQIAQEYGWVCEHVGDLTHRMSEHFSRMRGANVRDKAEKTLRVLTDPYSFERHLREQIASNVGYNQTAEHGNRSFYTNADDAFLALKALGKAYANEHRKLVVWNRPQWLGREAAIAVGEMRFHTATRYLRELLAIRQSGDDSWVAQAGYYDGKPYDPDAEKPMHVPTHQAERLSASTKQKIARGARAAEHTGANIQSTMTKVGMVAGGAFGTAIGGPGVGTGIGSIVGGVATDLSGAAARAGLRKIAEVAERGETKTEALRAGGKLFGSCLRTTGEIIVRGESSKVCRAPRPGTEAWKRLASYAKDVLGKLGVALGRQLGCGTYGCAFEVKGREDVVVKLTGDRAEVAALRAVANAIGEDRTSFDRLPALAKAHCVYGLLDDCDRPLPIYVIVQDRLPKNLDAASAKIINDYWVHILDLAEGKEEEEPPLRPWIEQELGKRGLAQVDALIDTVAELRRIEVYWTDLHSGNVLVDAKGRWKIVDLGFSRSPDTTVGSLSAPKQRARAKR